MINVGTRTLLAKSCAACGEFKQSKEFVKSMGIYKNSYCNKCRNEMAAPLVKEHQQEALDAAVRHRQPWTDQDIKALLAMIEKGCTGPQMALSLNRTVYSVYTMKNKLRQEA